MDTWDLNVYGPENNESYRYILGIIDNFSNFGLTVPLKNKTSQTMNVSSPNLFETDDEKEFVNKVFTDFRIKIDF